MTDTAERDRDLLVACVRALLMDLHPVYGNTSRRGRGIGGQMVTQQCSVIDPEGWEVDALDAIEGFLRAQIHRMERGGTSRALVSTENLATVLREDFTHHGAIAEALAVTDGDES